MSRFFLLTLILFLSFFMLSCSQAATQNVCFESKCIDVEVMRTLEERARGLQFRESLGHDQGMLFIFENSHTHSFWMKDTLIPLDMIWLDYAQRIVHIEKNVHPCKKDSCPSYTSPNPSLYVLEVNAGYADQWGISVGDRLDFHLNL